MTTRTASRLLILGALIALTLTLGGGVGARAGTTVASSLTKTGTDASIGSTARSAGTVGTTAPGRTITWVLHYANSTGAPASVKLTDPIGANRTFAPGSLQVRPATGLSPEWSTDGGSSWVTSEPASGVNAVGATGPSVLGSPGVSAQVGAPPPATIPTGGGDGWEALVVGGKVYNVFHAFNPTPLDCHSLATGARCSGYPTYASPNAGDPLGPGRTRWSHPALRTPP